MTDNHPMTPSPSQLDRWEMVARATTDPSLLNEPAICAGHFGVVHRKALRLAFAAGADQELAACCEWTQGYAECGDSLRAARRPKPPTLNSIALQMLGTIERDAHYLPKITDTIRRALEALDD